MERRRSASSSSKDEAGNKATFHHRLIEACKIKDLSAIKSILDQRPDLVNLRDKHDRNLLHYSVILLSAKEEVAGDLNSNSIDSDYAKNIDCFDYLTQMCESKLWCQQDSDGLSILHLAVISVNNPLVKYILFDHPLSIKYPLVCTLDNENHSPLHWAVITSNLASVKLLISFAGVKLALEQDLNGATPLHYATQLNDFVKYRQQLRLMLKNVNSAKDEVKLDADKKCLDRNNSIDLKASENKESLEILEFLVKLDGMNLECLDKDNRSPLLWASSSGNKEAISILLANGANLYTYDLNHLGALHCAASHGFTSCLECLLNFEKSSKSRRDSLKSASDLMLINQADNLNCTPLFYSVLSGNIDCLELLLDRGASANWQDLKGRTAAHFAALKGQLNSLKLLEIRGANLWLANKQGDLPLHYAIKSGRRQVVQWLLKNSPYENSVNAINNFGRAPIHLAILKDNADLVDYLIRSNANLNQLVKIKDKSTKQYHYETALDMANNLQKFDCLKLLEQTGLAKSAREVLAQREMNGSGLDRPGQKSALFKAADSIGPSPIGFETSYSSTESPEMSRVKPSSSNKSPRIPKLKKPPKPDLLPQSETPSSSSSLSQNSTIEDGRALLNGTGNNQSRTAQHQEVINEEHNEHEDEEDENPPYTSGISYNNQHMNASIKCKLYDHQHKSFPPTSDHSTSRQRRTMEPTKQKSLRSSAPAGINSGQEIITNVNVYTSPCPHCNHFNRCSKCEDNPTITMKNGNHASQNGYSRTNDYSDIDTSEGGLSDDPTTNRQRSRLPIVKNSQEDQQMLFNSLQMLPKHLPPSQNYVSHLPAIMSDHEDIKSQTSGRDGSSPSHVDGGLLTKQAEAEPRFDKSWRRENQRNEQSKRYRNQVVSPVAEYIHSGSPRKQMPNGSQQQHRSSHHSYYSQLPDFSQVKPKVDSRRSQNHDPEQQEPHRDEYFLMQPNSDQIRSRSMTNMKTLNDTPAGAHEDALRGFNLSTGQLNQDHPSRSVSRQTIIRTRRLSVDSVELASKVEKSIRKYKQETKLFEELQNLKRSQIRSGKANEALLVKRLIETFNNRLMMDFINLETYHGPYTYKSYERYLYDQLRKLSLSNQAKLTQQQIAQLFAEQQAQLYQNDDRDYDEEDLHAELELRRVLAADENCLDRDSFILEPSGALEEIRVKSKLKDDEGKNLNLVFEREIIDHNDQPEIEKAQKELAKNDEEEEGLDEQTMIENDAQLREQLILVRRASAASDINSSRRSSIEAELNRLSNLPLQVSEEETRRELNSRSAAEELSSAIITDVLGNVSTNVSRCASPPTIDDRMNEEEEIKNISKVSTEFWENGGEVEESRSKREPREPERSESVSPNQRRKSIVNIGNKIEIVNHFVGIEIDPADDKVSDEDDLPKDQDEEENSKPIESEAEQVKEEKMGQESDRDNKTAQTRSLKKIEEEKESEPTSPTDTVEEDVGPEVLEEKEENEKRQDLISRPTLDYLRRASSPPAYERNIDSKTWSVGGPSSTRRASVESTRGVDRVEKKVFTGYDLDEMRRHFRRNKKESINSEIVDSDIGSTSHNQQKTRLSPASLKRKLSPTKIPAGKYRIRVNLGEIKQRWNYIKARERIRKRDEKVERQNWKLFQPDENQRHQLQSESITTTSSSQSRKSQPNLHAAKNVDLGEEESAEESLNFIWLYELNKGFSLNKPTVADKISKSKQQHRWCSKRVIKIIDVRSLKRTLSLPESIIYSNDLLKRFNVLKL